MKIWHGHDKKLVIASMFFFRYVELHSLPWHPDSSIDGELVVDERRRASAKEGKRKDMGYFLFFRKDIIRKQWRAL
jgi:hypothetical protein